MRLPDGLVAVVERDCPAGVMVGHVLRQLGVAVSCQDAADSFEGDDTDLQMSYRLGDETVPALMRIRDGVGTARTVGWARWTCGTRSRSSARW